jgi:hypothetical protein
MTRNANGEGSVHKWVNYGKQSGYKGAITYTDELGNRRTRGPCSRLPSPPTTATHRDFTYWQFPRREGSVYHRTNRFRPYPLVFVLTFICISYVDVVLSKKVNQGRHQDVESPYFSLSR